LLIAFLLRLSFSAGSGGSFVYVKNSPAAVCAAKSAGAMRAQGLFAFGAGVKSRFCQGEMRGAFAFVGRSSSMTG